MGMRNTKFVRTKFEDFPVKLFFRLLSCPKGVPERFLGPGKWESLLTKWEEGEDSLENSRLLEDQKKTVLPLIKAQKAIVVLKWLSHTNSDLEEVLQSLNLPWDKDPEKLVEKLKNYIIKNNAQYENNLIQLKATQEQQRDSENVSDFSIEDAIASLNLAGFTVSDPNTLTIGRYRAMNKAIERNGRRKT